MKQQDIDDLITLARRAYATRLTGEYQAVRVDLRAHAAEFVPAVRALLTEGRTADAMTVVIGAGDLWLETGVVADGYALAEAALKAEAAGVDPGLRARTMLTAGELVFRSGNRAEAARWSEAAAHAAEQAGDVRTAGLADVNLARVAFSEGDADAIEAHARRAMDRAPDDLLVRRGALHMLGWAAYTAGDRSAAIERFERSMEMRATLGDEMGVAVELANLGDMATEMGDTASAADYLRRSTEVSRRRNDLYMLTALLGSAGVLAVAAERWDEGLVLLAACTAAYAATTLVPDPSTRQVIDEASARAKANLDADRARRAEARGSAMSLDAALERALLLFDELTPAGGGT